MPEDSWIAVVRSRMAEINLLAEWAGQVGYGEVRDKLRMANGLLIDRINARQENLDHAKKYAGKQGQRVG